MNTYRVRYVHKISPSDRDVLPEPVTLPEGALRDRTTLAAALRAAKVLDKGDRVNAFRTEAGAARVVVFPRASVWWSIILEAT